METNNTVSREQARALNPVIGQSASVTLDNISETLSDVDGLLCGFADLGEGRGEAIGLDLLRQCQSAAQFEASAAN